jgi:predicted RNase H-like HicB family nuclease
MNKELIFLVEEDNENGFVAKALGESIFTQADTIAELKTMIKDAILCHFEVENMPKIIRLYVNLLN